MEEAITAQCAKHHFDRAVAVCGQCGLTFCPACLVYAFGPNKPPFCIPCALTAGGVRRVGTAPKASWREKRSRRKQLTAQAEEAAAMGGSRAPRPPDPSVADERDPQPAEEQIDWSAPFEPSALMGGGPATPAHAPVAHAPVDHAPVDEVHEPQPVEEIDWSAPFEPTALAD